MGPDSGIFKKVSHNHFKHQYEHNWIDKEADNFTHPVVKIINKSDKTS
jgi:hypothetical protein